MAHDPYLITYPDRDALAHGLADYVEAALRSAVEAKGRASLAVSGGSSPRVVHGLLANRAIPWSQIDVMLVDERWVAPDQEGSNEAFAKETLLQGLAAEASFTGFWSDADDLDAGAEAASKAVDAIPQPFDVVLLGMGADGHTASWFPYADGLSQALADDAPTVTAVRATPSKVTGVLTERLTLSLPVVAGAETVALLLAGDEKRAVFDEALQDGEIEALPIRAILRKRPDMWVGWAP